MMMRYELTKNEAKVIRAINDYGEANLFELASMSQLTPNEVTEAAHRLASHDIVKYTDGDPIIRITGIGQEVRQTLLKSSVIGSRQSSSPSVSIVSEAEAADSTFDEMDSEQLTAAFDEELGKLEQ